MQTATAEQEATTQAMQAAHQTAADKEFRNRVVSHLRRAATLIEFGEAEPVEVAIENGEVYDTYAVKWLQKAK